MKEYLRNTFSFLFSKSIIFSGILAYRIRYILKNHIPLALYFHNPDKDLFENIIVWLKKKGFSFLSLPDFLSTIQNKTKTKGAVWLSFDDGYEENIDNVLPILNKYNIPATFFIPTKSVEEGFFWWDLVKDFSGNHLPDASKLWELRNKDRVKKVLEIQKEKLSIPKRAITLESLKKLSSNPLITFGNHTDDHVICINCGDEELSREIKLCEEKLMNWVGDKYVKVFSYPNGDYNDKVRSVVRNNNMTAAFTNKPKPVSEKDDIYQIPRLGVVDNIPFSENILHAVGIWQPIVTKLKGIMRRV